MTSAQKRLIEAICRRDWREAQRRAKLALQGISGKNPADAKFRDDMLEIMDSKKTSFDSIPANLEGILTVEYPKESFHPGRYYLSARNAVIAQEILDTDRASEQLSELDIHFLNATLLFGESGTGKTTFAKYIAWKLGVPLVYLRFSSAITAYLGSSSSNITRAFQYVTPYRCVFLLDELDAFAMRRGGSSSSSSATNELNRITISLMQCLDSLPNAVLLLATTNRPDVLDEAVLRRFTSKHEIVKLSLEERRAMAENYFKDVHYSPTEEELSFTISNDVPQSEIESRITRVLVSHIISERGLSS